LAGYLLPPPCRPLLVGATSPDLLLTTPPTNQQPSCSTCMHRPDLIRLATTTPTTPIKSYRGLPGCTNPGCSERQSHQQPAAPRASNSTSRLPATPQCLHNCAGGADAERQQISPGGAASPPPTKQPSSQGTQSTDGLAQHARMYRNMHPCTCMHAHQPPRNHSKKCACTTSQQRPCAARS